MSIEAGGQPTGWLVEGQAAEGLWGWESERRKCLEEGNLAGP